MDAPDDMTTNEKQLSLRLPVDLVDRVDAMVPVLSRLPIYQAFRLERSTAFRIALIRGLEELEREYGAKREHLADRAAYAGERAARNTLALGGSSAKAEEARKSATELTAIAQRSGLEGLVEIEEDELEEREAERINSAEAEGTIPPLRPKPRRKGATP